MGSLLKLKKKQAMIFLENMSDFVFGSCNVTVSFDDTMSITKAKTIHTHDSGPDDVIIGIQDIMKYDSDKVKLFQSYIPDGYMIRTFINIFHEEMHCIQNNDIYKLSKNTRDFSRGMNCHYCRTK